MTKFVWVTDTEFVARVRQSSDKRFFVRADDAVHFRQFSGRPTAALWKGHPRTRSVFPRSKIANNRSRGARPVR
ncbi:hypothetical protein MINTM008_21600 [Mycobacterium intracellulare]|uniref:Uncharacterized protein n=1 Tax=Mycobacterium intracellulare TaxID=1767 RepID=A0A7R7MTE8_MYCIT|nr:hypothetical protein MINTM002_19100 [Mycobacterium intracellulare]BCO56760.1 hypothetical protein MINTM005_20040 [Mycobacterium intracellulare]BCO62062.1 hypothetical protein MINTM006_20120 [Mycobacterium intracellulare]BCO67282.1 hypothetical protein MINTM007_18930 [Mycobacterium intracellulare]BCO72825.1 hypothetical protein MINTM008_21600 [Mycobacterium intracellulare]